MVYRDMFMQKLPSLLLSTLLVSTVLLQGCFPVVLAGAGVGMATNSASSPLTIGSQIDDSSIKARATEIVNQTPGLNYNSNVEISVFNSIVLILGQVPNQTLKDQLSQKIAAIHGVNTVYNQLTVGPPVDLQQYAQDSWITTRVLTKFVGNVNPTSFKIITENGVVYLMAVTTQSEGDQAAELASEVPGVVRVVKAYSYIQDPQPAATE